MVRRRKQKRPNGGRQSLYAPLVIITVPCDPPLDEQPTLDAVLKLEIVPYPGCAQGCLTRQNDGGNVLA